MGGIATKRGVHMPSEKRVKLILGVVLGVMLLASAAFLLRPGSAERLTATIQVDGKVVRELRLDTAADEVFSIEEQTGLPIEFEVRDHAIRFLHSDCPDKICINSGFLRRDMDIASCLPNRAVLSVASQG